MTKILQFAALALTAALILGLAVTAAAARPTTVDRATIGKICGTCWQD